ncbi:N-acetyllactosaminide beta-1,3-N-acetylglucosaminyltransferase 2 [Merluccius polli]|uniref:N-acetyllactosaminide beta-1,3-N-acetylglucosaminyltransferase 2 n=1 Tax=Merluccius polli TaxID=89951 RepID=A0AA47N025_MERPO|nr:N-acetyllactosaminide beta-1,3-N-acetylglucosaminyltransferase 2 [Merluccius polli]
MTAYPCSSWPSKPRRWTPGTGRPSGTCGGRLLAVVLFKGDDIFLNTPALVDYLQQQLGASARDMSRFMVGEVIRAVQPNRLKVSKYFVPDAFYIGLYPPYAGRGGKKMEWCTYHKIILVHKRTPDQVVQLWAQLKERQPLCCNVTER